MMINVMMKMMLMTIDYYFLQATNLLTSHHRNMNEMWSEMNPEARDEYKQYFLAYHDSVAK